MKATEIIWKEGYESLALPSEAEIPDKLLDIDDEEDMMDAIEDYLMDEYGYPVDSFRVLVKLSEL